MKKNALKNVLFDLNPFVFIQLKDAAAKFIRKFVVELLIDKA